MIDNMDNAKKDVTRTWRRNINNEESEEEKDNDEHIIRTNVNRDKEETR